MFVPYLLALLGFAWLLRRMGTLWTTPLERAVGTLNVSVPNVPLISVDKVTDRRMVIHWDPAGGVNTPTDVKAGANKEGPPLVLQASPSNLSHLVLYINGLQAGYIDGSCRSCTLDGLEPNTNYQIDLVAFNMASFRSRSSPIYVKTTASGTTNLNGSESVSMDHPDVLLSTLVPGSGSDQVMVHEAFRSRSRSSTLDGGNPPTLAEAQKHPHLIADINELKFLLESGLDEMKRLIQTYTSADREFKEEEGRLVLARGEARERRKLEDRNRAALRQEIKYLEEQRVKTENRIDSDKTMLDQRLKRIADKQEEVALWHTKIAQMHEEMKKDRGAEDEDAQMEVQRLQKVVFSLQVEDHGLETDIKLDSAQAKHMNAERDQLEELAITMEHNIDPTTGVLNDEALKALEKIGKIRPRWKETIERELQQESETKSAWEENHQRQQKHSEALKGQLESWDSSASLNRLLPQNLMDNVDIFSSPSVSSPQLTSLSALANAINSPSGSFLDLSGNSPFDYNRRPVFGSNSNTPPAHIRDNARDSAQFSKLLNSLSRGSTELGAATQRNSLEVLSRARSTSFGSSIWSNGNNPGSANMNAAPSIDAVNNNWGNMGTLGTPISLTSSPPAVDADQSFSSAQESLVPVPKSSPYTTPNRIHTGTRTGQSTIEEHSGTSPSFFRSRIFKFGNSPTKNGKAGDIETEDMDQLQSQEQVQSHHTDSFGSRSSRFFKLGSRKASTHSQNSGSTASVEEESTSSGSLAKRLTFSFKKERKETIEEGDEPSDED